MNSSIRSLLVLCSFLFVFSVEAAHHFTAIYQQEDHWRVDHFKAEVGKLQDLVESRSFQFRHQAEAYSQKVTRSNNKGIFRFTKTETNKPLWEVTESWSDEWESKYAEWVGKNFDADFFVRYNLETDCADAAYALRWIFSRINGLPASATLAGSGITVTHLTAKAEWDALPGNSDWSKDERFRAALDWLLNSVFTGTLYQDGYPVRISPETIRPGLINLLGGHTEVFSKVSFKDDEVPFTILYSTVPKMVRQLAARVYLDTSPVSEELGGLFQFRWPVNVNGTWSVIPKKEMKHYSLEQYDGSACQPEKNLAMCMIEKLGMTFNPDLVFKKLLLGLETTIQDRQKVVLAGYEQCLKQDCSPGSANWEDWSTPSRDKRLNNALEEAGLLAGSIHKSEEFKQWLKQTQISNLNAVLSIGQFGQRLSKGFISYDPRDSMLARWGANSEVMESTVLSKIEMANKGRQELIAKASDCRKDPENCKKQKGIYKSLSTSEIDSGVRKLVYNWKLFCKEESFQPGLKLLDIFETIWFQSPAPWDSVDKRMGKLASKGKGHLLMAKKIEHAGPNYLILDSNRLYDISHRKEVLLPGNNLKIGYDRSSGRIYRFDGKTFFLYNQDLQQIDLLETSINAEKKMLTHDFGNGWILAYRLLNGISQDLSAPKLGWLVNLKQMTSSEPINFLKLLMTNDVQDVFLVLENTKMILLKTKGESVEQLTINGPKETMDSFNKFANGSYLLTSDTYTAPKFYRLDEDKLTFIMETTEKYASMSQLNSHYLLVKLGYDDDSKGFIIDGNGSVSFKDLILMPGPSPEKGSGLFSVKTGDSIQPYLVAQNEIQKLNMTFEGEYNPIFSATDLWVSSFDYQAQEALLLDFRGNKLDSPTNVIKGDCYSMEWGDCHSEKKGFMTETFVEKTDDLFESFVSYGFSDGYKITDIFAYGIQSSSSEERVENEYEMGIVSQKPIGIKLKPKLVLWIPGLTDN